MYYLPTSCTLCIVRQSSWLGPLYPGSVPCILHCAAARACDRDSGPVIRVTMARASRLYTHCPKLTTLELQMSRQDSLAALATSTFLPFGLLLHGGMWIVDYSSQISVVNTERVSDSFSVPPKTRDCDGVSNDEVPRIPQPILPASSPRHLAVRRMVGVVDCGSSPSSQPVTNPRSSISIMEVPHSCQSRQRSCYD